MDNRDDDPAFRRRTAGKRTTVKPDGLLTQLKALEERVKRLEAAHAIPSETPRAS